MLKVITHTYTKTEQLGFLTFETKMITAWAERDGVLMNGCQAHFDAKTPHGAILTAIRELYAVRVRAFAKLEAEYGG